MRKFLLALALLPSLLASAQSYFDLNIQFDQYPNETAWFITQDVDTVATSPSYDNVNLVNQSIEERIFLPPGDYTITFTDNFGDGICCGFGAGFFDGFNACQGLLFEDTAFDSAIVEYEFTLGPCQPPATPITFRVNLANAPPEIGTPGVLGNWNGWQVIPMEYDEADNWFVTIPIQAGNYLWKFADFDNPDLQELPVGVSESPCFLFDEFGFVNRTLNVVDGEEALLPNFCWESCLPCGAIPGCTDPDAVNWNPWANFDNGSCVAQNVECGEGETLLEIVLTPDNFGSETSWILYGDAGGITSAPVGTYAGAAPGIPISTATCVPVGGTYDVVIEDTYGDGLCASCATNNESLPSGNLQILDCEGLVVFDLQNEFPDGNFGYNAVSAPVTPVACDNSTLTEGCTDSGFIEYNPEAVVDNGTCATPVVTGCLDPTQFNYNPDANVEDKIIACDFTLTIKDGVGDGWFGSWLGIYQFGYNSPQYQMGPDDGIEQTFSVPLNAYDAAQIYFFVTPQSITTAAQCGFTLTNPEGEVIIDVPFFSAVPFTGASGWYVYEIDPYCGNTCEPFVYGCMDATAANYSAEANTDDSSCYYEPGCTQAGYLEYYTQGFTADFDDGSCQTLAVFGCTDTTAFNYDELANVDNGGCLPVVLGCINELAWNYEPLANTDDGSCIPFLFGCTDATAFNFDADANTDDGSCIPFVYGCTDTTAFNYDPLANTDNGTCIEVVEGCTDPDSFTFNPLANTNDNSCCYVDGCTDVNSLNYDEDACYDDGSCIELVEGCSDPEAFNYDPEANSDTEDCLYDAGCSGGPGVPYWLNDECFAWVIDVDATCCEGEWDEVCVELYNYCQLGQPTSVEELTGRQIMVYPNPTTGVLNVVSALRPDIKIFSSIGEIVYSGRETTIDLSNMKPGMYLMECSGEDYSITKRIVVQ